MAIISLLIGLLVISVRGLNGGTSRRAAVGTLMGVFDQARAVAVTDGRATYVVFVSAPSGQAQNDAAKVAPTMWGRAYAVFEDPALSDNVTADNAEATFQPQQRSSWLYLPVGIAFKSDYSRSGTPASLTDSTVAENDTKFRVPAAGGMIALLLPYVKFDSMGQVVDHVNTPPQVLDPGSALLRVLLFEGISDSGGTETITRRSAGTINIKYALDEIILNPTTGRAKYTLDPAYNLVTPAPTPTN